MKHKPFRCSRCGQRSTTPGGVKMHVKAVHDGVGEVEKVPKKVYDDEPSFAETLIDGIIDGTWTEDGEYIGDGDEF